MIILSSDEHPLNAFDPIIVTDDGIETLLSKEHPSNALHSISVTDVGIVIGVSKSF